MAKELTIEDAKKELQAKLKTYEVGKKTFIFTTAYANYLQSPKNKLFYKGFIFNLRYSPNYDSPFEEDQYDDDVVLSRILIEKSGLFVNKRDIGLASFLLLNLEDEDNIATYSLENKELDAKAELENDDSMLDAMIMVRDKELTDVEAVYYLVYGSDPVTLSSYEIRRALNMYIQQGNAKIVANAFDNKAAMIKYKYKAGIAMGILIEDESAYVLKWAKSKKHILTVDASENMCDKFVELCLTPEGEEIYNTLLDLLNK